jgi:hypothetical protein
MVMCGRFSVGRRGGGVAEKYFEFLVRCWMGPMIWAMALMMTEEKN